MQAKIICTQKKILVACCLIPIISIICYSHLVVAIEVMPSETLGGYMECKPKKDINDENTFKSKILMWIILYFFIPAVTIVVLNTAIVIKLAQAHKLQRAMTENVRKSSVKSRGNFVKQFTRSIKRSSSTQSASSSAQSIR